MFQSTVVKGRVITDESGIHQEIPVLLTLDGPVEVLLDYLIAHWNARSPSWMIKVTAAVRLFLVYVSVHQKYEDEKLIFQNFRNRLITGTISAASDEDASNLWWSSRSLSMTNRIIGNLTDLFNWWHEHTPGRKNPTLSWKGSRYDALLADAAHMYRRNKSWLGHTWSPVQETGGKFKTSKASTRLSEEQTEEYAFPEDRILELIFSGFKVGGRFNFRDMLITLLLNGAGFRESEPFHLYLWDVMEDPNNKGSALVLIHHPEFGAAPPDPDWLTPSARSTMRNRTAYLAERFGLTPRNWILSKGKAGWKGGKHEKKNGYYFKRAYWFIPEFGKIFWEIWNLYIDQVAHIDPLLRNHPFAFVNLGKDPVGGVYKIGKFQRSHAAAVRRIGLVPSKNLGTSEHGHRHAYGQRLRKAGMDPEMIRRFMHHADPNSQEVYTRPDHNECLRHLKLASERLDKMTAEVRAGVSQVSHFGITNIAIPI